MRYRGYFSEWSVPAGAFIMSLGILWLLDMLGIIEFNICIIGPILLIIAGLALILHRDWHLW